MSDEPSNVMSPDVTSVDAVLTFDPGRRVARGHAVVAFTAPPLDGGRAALDLRQPIGRALLDGEPVGFEALEADGLAVGDLPRVVDRPLVAGTQHTLEVEYEIGTPSADGALALDWTNRRPGIVFDLWMSDLAPGRYLESYVPAPLVHDEFALTIEVHGLDGHALLANGDITGMAVRYPAHYTALSPMLVIAPEERVESIDHDGVVAWKLAGPEIDLAACHAETAKHLAHNSEIFGPYSHRSPFCLYVWGTTRGMEYDGGTTSSVGAIEHETFHSWFGRGLKPRDAKDGWIDEAFTTWYTAGPPRQRQWAQPFDMNEPPVVLRPGGQWARFTPREAYTDGARFFAGVADAMGGGDALIAAMASWYRKGSPRLVTTDDLQQHLADAGGRDLAPFFTRFVHGLAAG